MKTIATVKLGTDRLTAAALLEKGRNHVKMTTGNAAYPTPEPPLVEITQACDDLERSIQQVLLEGGKVAHSLKRTRSAALKALIKELAGYVQAASGGDRDLILSAGFECRRDGRPVDMLGTPQNLRALRTDHIGRIPLRWGHVLDSENNQVFINYTDPDEEKSWVSLGYTSKSSFVVEGLESLKYYWFRVQAMGRKGLLSPMSRTLKALAL